jgi:vanillate O-demethylase monooxygenase subunit
MTFLRNQWYCAALSHELKEAPLGRIIANEPIVMYRRGDGTVVALEDRCCHRRAPLSKGRIEGDNLRCGYHGFLYDARGQVIWVPGQDKAPPGARVRAYPLAEKHGFVWLWLGEPALADPAKAPAFTWNDDPRWASCTGHMRIECDYMLLVDNLLDMSHLPFLHINTIGSARDLNARLEWERGPDWLRGVRQAPALSPSPRQRAEGVDFDTDRVQIMTYTPPGNVVIEVIVTEAGKKHGDPSSRYDTTVMVLDSMTPETESTCHYFFGLCRDYDIGNTALTEFSSKAVLVTFGEDKDMLEAEQKIIDLAPHAPQIDVVGDHGGLQARRMVERLLAEEQQGTRQAAE